MSPKFIDRFKLTQELHLSQQTSSKMSDELMANYATGGGIVVMLLLICYHYVITGMEWHTTSTQNESRISNVLLNQGRGRSHERNTDFSHPSFLTCLSHIVIIIPQRSWLRIPLVICNSFLSHWRNRLYLS